MLLTSTLPHLAIMAAPSTYCGDFGDTNHPGCPRKIAFAAAGDETNVTITGHDGDASAPWGPCPGKIAKNSEGARTITIDLSSKGGPADLEGVWEQSGIRWIRDGATKIPAGDDPKPNWPKQ